MQDSSDIPFRIRLNNIDYYRTEPTPLDPPFPPPKGSKFPPKIPIIRIFGSTEAGQKVCAHIHGVFPYVYIEYPVAEIGLNPIDRDRWLRALRKSLDKALGARGSDGEYQNKPIRKPYVANISLVKGVPFYGFHVGWKYYAKIYLLDPRNMTKLSQILLSGAILQTVFQPYEAHIQYILQFMIDFNLYGCGFVDCRTVRFRQGFPDIDNVEEEHQWRSESIPAHWMLLENRFPRQSHCSLEVDIHAQDILNRKHVSARLLHHDFIERTKPTPPDLKLLHSLAELWKDENSRRGPTDQLNMEGFVASSGTRGPCEPWGGEDERWDKVNGVINSERQKGDGRTPHFEGFVRYEELDYLVQTALDSVEDFFPSQEIESDTSHVDEDDDADAEVEVDVNIGLIGGINDEDFLDGNDGMELAEIDKEMFEKNEEEEEEIEKGKMGEEGIEKGKARVEELEPKQHQDKDQGKGNGDSSDSGDVMGKQGGSMDDLTPQSSEYGLPDFEQTILDEIQWPDGKNSHHTHALGDHSGNSSDNDPEPTPNFPQYKGMTVKKLEDGSIGVQDGQPTTLKRKDRPNTPNSDKRAFKVSKTAKTLPETQLPSPIPINSVLGKRKAPETLDDNSPSWSPGTLEASTARVITLPLSQERPSQSNGINQRKASINTPDFIPTMASSQIASEISDTDASIILEKEMPNIISQGQGENWHVHNARPPRNFELAPIEDFGMPQVEYPEPHYSDEKDIPENDLDYGGMTRTFKAKRTQSSTREESIKLLEKPGFRFWEIVARPPTRKEAIKWLEKQKSLEEPTVIGREELDELGHFSQIEGPTQKNKHGFKFSQNKKSKINHELQPLSIMSLEVHVNTRGKLVPDPEQDPIASIFWCLQSNDGPESNGIKDGYHVGILAVDEEEKEKTERNLHHHCRAEVRVEYTELDVVNELVDIVRSLDPDILTGYEVHSSSWGYIIERARKVWGMDLCDDLSRVRQLGHGRFGNDIDPWGFNTGAAIRITGRHMINIWRAMRGELNLLGYTMENVVFHLLHRRIPHYAYDTLTKWYKSGNPGSLSIVLKYYILRVQLNLEIIDQQELVSRTSEQARILGVDFNSVFSRGSQFKVESLMFRIAKPENFMLVSPSKRQVGGQNALECLPLVLEPKSNFYTSPVVVLDFQSLYPSIMIAYNHCYSTFIGRVDSWNGQDKMGFQVYKRTPRLLELCKDHINISPNGMMFIKPNIRKSLLAKMLAEILDTRVMVKNGMKRNKEDKQLHKLLNNRQLALKLIANVTYGYTSASFSGRMPCAEIADSIVQSGRETLEKAILMINNNDKWGAEVVYGDTDSLFVHLKGKTKAQAFDIGEEIAARVTSMNPKPIKLKFEKVYHPCVLLAKKRYVGFKYEYRDQNEPEFDAKGIETVRRDGNPAVQKMVEKSLKILFRSSDLSQVKSYVTRQWTKIMKGDVSIQDFTIAKEVKLGNYAEGITPPPAVKLALERMVKDPRNEPQYGERYPFVVVASGPNTRLVDKSVEVEVLLHNSDILSLDAEYYITKTIIPPLARIFNLVGADVELWYKKLPKVQRLRRILKQKVGVEQKAVRKTMESFMTKSTMVCAVCDEKAETRNHICLDCMNERGRSVYKLQTRLSQVEKWNNDLHKICWSCSGLPWGAEIACNSQACPIYYSRIRQNSLLAYEREEIEPHLKTLENIDEKDLVW